ncbi:MAG: hypothetical protein PF436_04880 [Prolixibacteraceae bacterium]|jgi:hypothetical protein|nr:hypothetical protein [Prolixibacteraceae bacterium]
MTASNGYPENTYYHIEKAKRFSLSAICLILLSLISCVGNKNEPSTISVIEPWCIEGISELKKGDILVKPNANLLPGSSVVENGFSFGHAVIVTKGYTHKNTDSLLRNITIIESMSTNVPIPFQVREIAGYTEDNIAAFNNTSFSEKYKGNRYRLRLNISESQIDSIIAFARNQQGDISSWNAMKSYPLDKTDNNWADNSHWYCSLLIWQSVIYVTGIDLDINQGYMIYPNDLINHPLFDNTDKNIGRTLF